MRYARHAVWAVPVLIAAVVAADAVVGVRTAPPPPPATEDPAVRAAAVRTAFAGPPVPHPDGPAVAAFLDGLGAAVRRHEAAAVADAFDPDRLLVEAADADLIPRSRFPRTADELRQRVRGGVWAAAGGGWLGGGWAGVSVRRVDRPPGSDEAVVYARMDTPAGPAPTRWWLRHRGAGWRAFDVEDVRIGVRASEQVAAVVALGDDPAPAAEVAKLRDAAATADPAHAEELLAAVDADRLPRPHRAMLALARGAAALAAGRPADAVAYAADADATRPGMPAADLIRATAWFRLGRWNDVVPAARRYGERLGPDPRASLVLGLSLAETGRPADGYEVLATAAVEFPDDPDLAAAVRRVRAIRPAAGAGRGSR